MRSACTQGVLAENTQFQRRVQATNKRVYELLIDKSIGACKKQHRDWSRALWMLGYLELAKLMQDSLHHPEGFVIVSTPAPNLIHSQAHEVVMDAHQQHIQVQLLHVVRTRSLVPADCKLSRDGNRNSSVLPMAQNSLLFTAANFTGLYGTNLKQVNGSQT